MYVAIHKFHIHLGYGHCIISLCLTLFFTFFVVYSQLDQGGARCSLIGSGQHVVLASLLAELLFLRGEQCRRMGDLPLLYQQHFGVPLDLSCLGVLSVTDLLQLPEISQVVQVSSGVRTCIVVCII